MKTALQELIEWMEKDLENGKKTIGNILEKSNELLEKEKEQILRAFELGMHECLAYDANSIKYYNQTYNQKK
jgi:hypothetical protein